MLMLTQMAVDRPETRTQAVQKAAPGSVIYLTVLVSLGNTPPCLLTDPGCHSNPSLE